MCIVQETQQDCIMSDLTSSTPQTKTITLTSQQGWNPGCPFSQSCHTGSWQVSRPLRRTSEPWSEDWRSDHLSQKKLLGYQEEHETWVCRQEYPRHGAQIRLFVERMISLRPWTEPHLPYPLDNPCFGKLGWCPILTAYTVKTTSCCARHLRHTICL